MVVQRWSAQVHMRGGWHGMVRSLRPRCSVRQADVLMFASDRTQSLFRELRLGIGLRVTFAVPGGPGAQVFRCPKTSSHASWPGSSVRTPLTGWRKPPSMPTVTIPIVAATAGDMVVMGIVTSLAHPGGNITGSTFFVPESRSKGITTRRSACRASNFCRTTGA